ncbi:uncharacterized protein LOC128240867 isoform X2 [Mya arenaria]|uniref:uncharacterized protein LOC128240867 isoform X2 n=1 Tax=Mya arenaria TaxID=6604 RepID=UPI0022E57989|nr:uncharacterized protein LOC128240867 isoform X2 [Mya arenaria]
MATGYEGGMATGLENNLKVIDRQEENWDALEVESTEEDSEIDEGGTVNSDEYNLEDVDWQEVDRDALEVESTEEDYDGDDDLNDSDYVAPSDEEDSTDEDLSGEDEATMSEVIPVMSTVSTSAKTVQVQKSNLNSKGNLGNKSHACVFCHKLRQNIARHYEREHDNELEVGRILALKPKTKERRKAWELLVNKGDFAHNFNVLEKGYGQIIPKYRKSEESEISSLLPCQFCSGLYKKKELWKHQKSCNKRNECNSCISMGPIAAGKKMLPKLSSNEKFETNVLNIMRDDSVKQAVLSDSLILQFGMNEYEKQGDEHRTVYTSNKMRELGRLLITLRARNIKSIDECMRACNWDIFIECVKKVSQFDNNSFGIPSLALNLGYRMKNVAEEAYFQALKLGDTAQKVKFESFLKMYQLKWKSSISSQALRSLENIKYNKPKYLPLVEDVVLLNKFLKKKTDSFLQTENKEHLSEQYPEFAKVCLAHVILFNRKRSGEAQRMTVKQYKMAKKGGRVDPVVMSILTEFEKKLCQTHLRVEIRGKKGRKVPVLFTKEMQQNIEMLLKMRSAAGISDDGLLFATPRNERNPYRGTDALRKMATSCGMKDPSLITSTNLRKQLATLAQILNMKENSQDLLATFQGHDIRIHREFYRLPEDVLQIAKMSKVLRCINNGTINKFSGCDFEDITFNPDEAVESDTSDSDDGNESGEDQIVDHSDITEGNKENPNVVGKVAMKRHRRDDLTENEQSKVRKENPKEKAKKTADKHTWSNEEKEALKSFFEKHIRLSKVPGKLDCLNAQRKHKCLVNINWKKIKFAVYNMLKARKNMFH